MCAARDLLVSEKRVLEAEWSRLQPPDRSLRRAGSAVRCAAERAAPGHPSAGTTTRVLPSPPVPKGVYSCQTPVSPVLLVLGGKLGSLFDGQRQSRAGEERSGGVLLPGESPLPAAPSPAISGWRRVSRRSAATCLPGIRGWSLRHRTRLFRGLSRFWCVLIQYVQSSVILMALSSVYGTIKFTSAWIGCVGAYREKRLH